MASAQSLALGVAATAVLMAGAGAWLWHRRKLRRKLRQNSWRELCLRLELTPRPDGAQAATGELPETSFLLHDTGSAWLVELPLAQPLLPPGLLLLSPDAPTLPPHLSLRALAWDSTSPPPGVQAWSVEGMEASGKVEAPPAFLAEATLVMQTHAPLRVEPQRLIQALRVGDVLSVNEARGAVRVLHATARRWHEVVQQHGRPRVQPLPPPEPVPEPSAQEAQAPEPAPSPKPKPRARRTRERKRRVSSHELVVDFNALPRLTRERFVQATRPKPDPEVVPIMTDLHFRGGWLWRSLVAGISAFCVYVLHHLSTNYRLFGVVQGPGAIAAYAILLFCALAAAVVLLFQGKWRKALPFHPGRYVLPFDFVDATTRYLRIIPLKALDELTSDRFSWDSTDIPTEVSLRFKGIQDAETFVIPDRTLAMAQTQRLKIVHDSLATGQEPKGEDLRRRIDPFYEARQQPGGLAGLQNAAPSAHSGEGPLAQEVPWWFRPAFLLLLAALASGVLSPILWRERNRFCDEAAFADARQDLSGQKLAKYAASQGSHVAEARELGMQRGIQTCEQERKEACWWKFLSTWPGAPQSEEILSDRIPRLVLESTPRTVAELDRFLNKYPRARVAKVVREELLPEAEFKALPSDSVLELRRFLWRNPRSPAKNKVEARIHELFAAAQAELQRQASPHNPQAVLFLREVIASLESSETALMQVRFRRQVAPALADAWGPVRTDTLEGRTVKALGNAFRQVFPDDILTPIHGESLPEQLGDRSVKEPEIDILYTISRSGTARVQFDFDVALRRPGALPVSIRYSITLPPDLPANGSGAAPNDAALATDMTQLAFAELNQKLGALFFRAGSQAFQTFHP